MIEQASRHGDPLMPGACHPPPEGAIFCVKMVNVEDGFRFQVCSENVDDCAYGHSLSSDKAKAGKSGMRPISECKAICVDRGSLCP